MNHVIKSRLPKHVREALRYLRRLGAEAIQREIGAHYVLSWTVGARPMRITLGLAASAKAYRKAWGDIRTQFRRHGLLVPEC